MRELRRRPRFRSVGEACGALARSLSGRDVRNVAEPIDEVVQNELASPVFRFRVLVDALKLGPAFRTTILVGLCGEPLQSRCLGERDARPILANGVDGQTLKLRLCQSAKDFLKIAVEPRAGRYIIIIRCHNSHTRLVRGAPPPTIIP
ncbi:hypothetical protein ABIB95_008716 [Bradyrhizobium sp. LA2.1]